MKWALAIIFFFLIGISFGFLNNNPTAYINPNTGEQMDLIDLMEGPPAKRSVDTLVPYKKVKENIFLNKKSKTKLFEATEINKNLEEVDESVE